MGGETYMGLPSRASLPPGMDCREFWDAVFASLKKINYQSPLDIELYGESIRNIDADCLAGKEFVESLISGVHWVTTCK